MKLQRDTLVCELQPALGAIRLQSAETLSCAMRIALERSSQENPEP